MTAKFLLRACILALCISATALISCSLRMNQPERSKAGQIYQWSEAKGKRFLSKTQRSISTVEAWQERSEQIRAHVLQATGLYPLPKKAPLNAIFGKKRTFEGYATQNMAFESLPSVFVTGTLYWPSEPTNKPAAILSFHGHWPDREDYGRYRPDVQKRCAAMARMGAVVLSIDMVGYGQMVDYGWRHKHPETMKLQIWNSIRAIDFLETLNIDPERIACTGASGGGTQTFHLAAIDPRISVSVPVVMISYRHFGGCICELGMPIHEGKNFLTNNVEIAACTAPNPLLLISVGTDATETTPDVEFPFIRHIYGLFGKSKMVENAHLPKEEHGYGYHQRAAAYPFLAKHLGLDLSAAMTSDGKLMEEGIVLEDIEALYMFAEAPLPERAITNNAQLVWE